ncbi:MAG: hypothetical protein ACI9CD_000794 [Candidatus Deianiraeaceae bacterium]|jgi:hypothetical protein
MKEYFEDAKKWYYLKYIQSLRFIFFSIIITIVAVLMSFLATKEAYDVVSSQRQVSKVIFTDYDISLFPSIQKIGRQYHSNDMNILLYTVSTYIKNFESYPKTNNQYTAYVQKVKYLQKYSSSSVISLLEKKFKEQYSIKLSNGGFVKASIQDITFNVDRKSILHSMRDFLLPEPIPKKAMAKVLLYIYDGKKILKKEVRIEMDIYFQKIQKQKNGKYNGIKFFVNSYRYV